MTDVDPITGPSYADRLYFIVPDDGDPYTVRVTYQQVNPDTEHAEQLEWTDSEKWWVPMQRLTADQLAHSVDADTWQTAVNSINAERQKLVDGTREALLSAGLTTDQANLLLEGK